MGLFWAINAVAFALVHSLGIMLPSMSKDLALSPIHSGWLASSYFLLMCLVSLPLSSWLSRYEPGRLVTLSALLAIGLIFAQGLAPNFTVAMITRVGFVLTIITRMTAGPLFIQRWFPTKRISRVNAIGMVTVEASLAVAMPVLPFIMNLVQGWRNTYHTFSILASLACLVWLIFSRAQPKSDTVRAPASQERSPLRAIFKYKVVWLLGIAVFGSTATWSGFSTFWPTYMTESYGIPLTSIGFIIGLSSFGTIAGYLMCGPLAERIGKRKPFLLMAGVAMPLLNFATLYTGSLPALAAICLVRGFTWIFMPIVMTVPYEIPNIKPREVVVAIAMIMTLLAAGGASGPLIAGFIAKSQGSLYTALASICVLPVTLIIAGLLLREPGREDKKAASIL